MKKTLELIAPLLVSAIIVLGIFIYFKIQETNYEFIMGQVQKKQKDFAELVEFYGEIEPDFPDKIINSKTILGIDTNHNGIRDDIDVWIDRSAYDQNETKAMRQYARAKQEWLHVCEEQNSNDSSLVTLNLKKAEICLETLSDYQRKIPSFSKDKLELLILNTDRRKTCHEFYLKTITPKVNLNGEEKNFYCDFKVEDPAIVLSGVAGWRK